MFYGVRLSESQRSYIASLLTIPSLGYGEVAIKCSVTRKIITDLLADIQTYENEIFRLQREVQQLEKKLHPGEE